MLNKVAYKQVLMVSLNVSITHTAVSEVCAASQSVAETRTNTQHTFTFPDTTLWKLVTV